MTLALSHLDEQTRALMLDELQRDVQEQRVYLSPRLNQQGRAAWVDLLRDAMERGTESMLAVHLRAPRLWQTHEERERAGRVSLAKVSVTAPETLAEGEFNRYYVRAICRRALEGGATEVTVYRAKASARPRPESERKLGTRVDAQTLLDDLRTHQGVEPALGVPPGPNSGLRVRLS